MPAIIDHFIIHRKEMINDSRKTSFCSITGTSASPSISLVRQAIRGIHKVQSFTFLRFILSIIRQSRIRFNSMKLVPVMM